jgi:putative nucleotidyltransferase with HDIG domain
MLGELRAGRQLADQVAIALANASLLEDLDALSSGALTALARTIDANSPWTAGHSERVTHVSLMLGERLGLSAGDLNTLYRGGLLHDIGKIAIPAAILNKPGALTDEEFAVIKQHPSTGARILSPIGVYRDTIPIVMSHHERLDGSGYPQGLEGDQIPLLARVAAVADVYDALSSARPYRPGWPVERVVEHITNGAGVQFDAAVTEALVLSVEAGVLGTGRDDTPSPTVLREESLGNSGVQNAVSTPRSAPVPGR